MAYRASAGASTDMVFDSALSNGALYTESKTWKERLSVLLIWYEQPNFCSIGHLKCPPKIGGGKTLLSYRIIVR